MHGMTAGGDSDGLLIWNDKEYENIFYVIQLLKYKDCVCVNVMLMF